MIKSHNIIIILMLMIITSCTPIYDTQYNFESPATTHEKKCANNCVDKLTSCLNSCRYQHEQCRNIQSLKAENSYLQYVMKCQNLKVEIQHDKSYFENYSICNNNCSDQCHSSHRMCHVNCGGKVIETRRCVAFCK